MPYDDLFLSPHLDDAVFSCAGQISRCVDAGRRVRVATVFGHADEAEGAAGYQQRRQEDARALSLLGADRSWLALPDAPFRHPEYRSYETLLLGPIRDDDQTRQQIRDAVLAEIRRCQPRIIYLPLAVGTHVDHRLVFDLWPHLREFGALRFYEDRPYVLVAQALRLRLRQIGSEVSEQQASAAPDLATMSPRQILAAHFRSWLQVRFVTAHLPPGAERLRCARSVARQLRRPLDPGEPGGPRLDFSVEEFDAAEVGQILPAITSYASQLDAFVGHPDEIPALLRDHARRLGSPAAHAERFWHLI